MGMFAARNGSIAGFSPTQPSWIDKVGLIGDILTGNPVTKTRLDEDFAFNQAQYQAQHPNPIKVGEGETYIDPLSGKVVFSGPAKLPTIAQNVGYLNGLKPGLGDSYAQNYANNGGGQGPGVITVNGQQMMRVPGAAAQPQPSSDDLDRLRRKPEEAPLFEQIYGPGSAARYLTPGGAAPIASVPFPLTNPLPVR